MTQPTDPRPDAPQDPASHDTAPQDPHPQQHDTQPVPPPPPAGLAAADAPAAAPQQPGDPFAVFAAPGAADAAAPGTAPATGPEPAATRRPGWVPLVAVGAGAALLASLGTAALTGAFDSSAASPAAADLSTIGAQDSAAVPVSGSTSESPDWEAVAAAVQASVVAIEVDTRSGTSQGSGVIVDADGHVVTNAHVVEGASGEVRVTLSDGRLFQATVVGSDATTDLAVLAITDAPDDLTVAVLGDSGEVTVGQPVMAVGNPLGLANTVTTGIVSAVDRPVTTESTSTASGTAVVTNAIQIDAAINPGNSGGPLFDASGRVIGITSSIATMSSVSGSIGIGFAIPVNLVQSIAEQLINDGSAEHAFLGVSLSDGTATADGVTRRGATVEKVVADSPAQAAGLQVGDVIVAVDGQPVGGAESLTARVRAQSAGDAVTLTVVRDGQALDVEATLAASASEQAAGSGEESQDGSGSGSDGGGQSWQDMTPEQLWEWLQQQRNNR